MKGLLRNNFYAVESSFKLIILISFIGSIAVIIISLLQPASDSIIYALISGILGGFGALAGTAIQKDINCKWNKFELTMPISRRDIVAARYLSFLVYIFVGIIICVLSTVFLFAANRIVNLERLGYAFTFGLAFALSIPTFLYPLVLIFGTDKNEILLFFSIALGLLLFFGTSILTNTIFKDIKYYEFLFRIGYLIGSSILFALSYLFSLSYYKKKICNAK